MLEGDPSTRLSLRRWILRSSGVLFDLPHLAEVILAVLRIDLVMDVLASLSVPTALKIGAIT